MSIRRSWVALGLCALMLALVFPPGSASAAHDATLRIEVGRILNNSPAETMRFYPGEINVHSGDILNFYGEFHTATLIPSSYASPEEWKATNATNPGDPFHGIQDNPDNVAIPWKLMGDNPFTRNPECGGPEQNSPCPYTGSDEVDSGLLLSYLEFSSDPNQPPTNPGFDVVIRAREGTSFWVICRIHPNMLMKVNVVSDDVATPTQEQIDAEKAASIAADEKAAEALHKQLQKAKSSKSIGNGRKEWRAYAGYDTDNFALLDMYPANLTVKKGDKVRWEFSELRHETHTATHPVKHVKENPFEAPLCDPNEDHNSGGETLANFNGPFPTCPEGQVFELALPGANITPTGDGVVKSASDLESSGVGGQLSGDAGRGFEPYTVTMNKPAKKVYKFVCYIHPFMVNAVKVKAVR